MKINKQNKNSKEISVTYVDDDSININIFDNQILMEVVGAFDNNLKELERLTGSKIYFRGNSIIIKGKIGFNVGLLMKRGTIILEKQKLSAPYLNYNGKNNYIFLKVIQSYLEKISDEFKYIFPKSGTFNLELSFIPPSPGNILVFSLQ